MSRHHITPPAVYLPPPPKPKETRRKRRVGHAQGASDVGESEDPLPAVFLKAGVLVALLLAFDGCLQSTSKLIQPISALR